MTRRNPPEWVEEYIGVPFEERGRDPESGWDCWGLFQYCQREHLGLELPGYLDEYDTIEDEERVSAAVMEGIQAEWEEVTSPKLGDGVVLNIMAAPMHVGLVVSRRHFMHVFRGIETVIERLGSLRWENRVEGFYRHESRID